MTSLRTECRDAWNRLREDVLYFVPHVADEVEKFDRFFGCGPYSPETASNEGDDQ